MSSAICFNLDQSEILSSGNGLNIIEQCWLLTTLQKIPFKNTVGKGEDAGNQYFLLFQHCFPESKNDTISAFVEIIACKCFHFEYDLTLYHTTKF